MRVFFVLYSALAVCAFGQQPYNFTGLRSAGPIPADFTVLSTEKYKLDYKESTDEKLDKEFYINTRFFVDDLLLSGKVVFNDSISNYVRRVAGIVLKDNPEIYRELRFYTIRSTAVNAFSTDQGIIFVTTGLVARLKNEAHLAFILAHEISHYTNKHVRNSYVQRELLDPSTGRYSEAYESAIRQMSIYNQNNEFEADEDGADLYLRTDYDVREVMKTFDVLLHSDLPWQNIRVPDDYFNTAAMEIPSSYFVREVPGINVDAGYDDKGHSHPNIEKRIDKMTSKLGRITSGDKKFIVSEESFYYARNLARFELVSLNLAQRNYVLALYEIFSLEKEFSSEFLDLSKVKALYGLVMYKNRNKFTEVTLKESDVQGESFKLHAFFNKISKDQLNIIALRHAYDLYEKNGRKPTFELYLDRLKMEMVTKTKGTFKKLKDIPFREQLGIFNDTASYTDSARESAIKELEQEFHLYALHDLVSTKDLIGELSDLDMSAKSDLLDDKHKPYVRQDRKERNRVRGYGIDTINVISPKFENYGLNREKKEVRSEKKEVALGNIYSGEFRNLDMDVNLIDAKQLDSMSVEEYNHLATIHDWMTEVLHHMDLDKASGPGMITSSHEEMAAINARYGSSNYLFSGVFSFKMRHEFSDNDFAQAMLSSVYFAPLGLIDLLIIHNYFQYVVIEINSETDRVEFVKVHNVNMKGLNKTVRFYTYTVLKQLNTPE